MKKKLLTLLALPAFLMVGCENGTNNMDLPDNIPSDVTPEEAKNIADGFFNEYSNMSAHNRLKAIADDHDGIQLEFNIYQKINNDIEFYNFLTLGRKGNVVWAEDTYCDVSDPRNIQPAHTYKGAVEYVAEPESFEAYYGENSEPYTYYGTAYRSDIDFSIQDVEDFFSLSDYLLAYLMSQTNAYIKTYANRKSLMFSMSNIDMQGQSMEYSNLEIAFDWDTRLIMYYNYWYINPSTSTVIMTVFSVNAFKDSHSVVVPTLVK